MATTVRPGGSGGADQTTRDSAVTAQAGSIDAHAPVRVASDGDDDGAGTGTSGGPQSVDDSVFTVQIGALELFAPIRVASDGDSSRATESGGGPSRPRTPSAPCR